MTSVRGYKGKVLRVNLTTKEAVDEPLNLEWARKYVGGMGLGARMLYHEIPKGTDPLSPENKAIIVTGPLTGTIAPACGKYALVTKSPLTGIFLDSFAGGYFGAELKYAGYDALIVEGKAENPSYVWIKDEKVKIEDAESLWGKDTHETEDALKEKYGKDISVLTIGPAGENLVRYALVNHEYYRQHGRGGAGAVFGSKNLKAVAVKGTGRVEVADPEGFVEAAKETTTRHLIEQPDSLFAISWKDQAGTPELSGWTNEVGALPTKNFQSGFFKEMGEKLGPEAVKKLRVRNRACIQCPMACSNFLKVEEGPYAGSMVEGPEYETLALLGSNCNLSDLPAVVALNLLCDRMGMDVISTGNTLAWAMECYEKGILSKEDLDGVELRWGDSEAMITMVNKIARREGIGDLLAEGVKRASEKIGKGSERFAMQVKGLELPAYEPRAAISMPLAYATADRGGCHLRSWPIGVEVWGTFWLDADPEKGEKNIPIETERWNPEGKAYIVYRQQHHYGLKFSSIMCDFALPPISDPIADLVARATGWDDIRDRRELERTSERIINMTRLFNVREGLRRKDDEALPWRIFNEPIQDGPTKGVQIKYKDFKKMLEEYYELRQWDENGIPKKEKLIELGMEDLAEEVERL